MLTTTYVLLWLAMIAYAVHQTRDERWSGWTATGLTIAAWGTLTIELIKRGLEAGHWPLTNRYEFALCFVWAIVGVYLLLEASWRERRGGAFVLAVALVVAIYAINRPADEQTISPLLPALRSVWLQVHVLTAAVGYGAIGVGAGLGLMRWLRQVSFEKELERAMERAIALSFPWLTLSILTGAIWAQKAWGRYWGWDPKETWALITWLWVLLILHVRPLRRWRGRRLAALIVLGFGIVLFTFVGVPWLVRTVRLETLHGF
ncbi:MAG: cytochrome c biogenesis protein CcsA [Chloroflexi bacterium]|nr:cytochrome c biogenesis protein CcsA [Chloroflexota bacterium]